MPAEPKDAPMNTGVAGRESAFPSPSSSTSDSATPGTDANDPTNQGQLPSRPSQLVNHVTVDVLTQKGINEVKKLEVRARVSRFVNLRGTSVLNPCKVSEFWPKKMAARQPASMMKILLGNEIHCTRNLTEGLGRD